MEAILLYALSVIGMTFVIVDGSIMEWFRTFVKSKSDWLAAKTGRESLKHFGDVVGCYLCCGVWCGFLMGLIWISYNPVKVFACGMAGGFLANFAATVMNYLEVATIFNLPPDDKEEK